MDRRPAGPAATPPLPPLTTARRRAFLAAALLLPFLLLGTLEGALRLGGYGGNDRLFTRLPVLRGRYAGVNKRFAARYFVSVKLLPTPPNDVFLVSKPRRGLRIFVLGESTANGFPYGFNGTFSRVVQDALQDVLPGDTVEVVNLGVAAVTTFALCDQVDEILEQQPDAVLIYAGHNEFYGALGAASSERINAPPAAVRAYLRLQRFRFVLLGRNVATAVLRGVRGRGRAAGDPFAPLMRQMVGEELITLDSPLYARGREQFRDNLRTMLLRFQAARVPVFIGSLTSNLRDQPPFRSVATAVSPPAQQVFDEARAALARGRRDTAQVLFARARDLDALRFRASSEFNEIIRELADETGAHYVPVAEAFAAAAEDGIPGAELFWEHLHPREQGYHLMGRAYFEAVQRAGFLGRAVDLGRLRPWPAYRARMELTEFDHRFAWHQMQSLVTRWPFVDREDPAGYPFVYRPRDAVDSLAFDAGTRGVPWARAKEALAQRYRARGDLAAALAEYRGLIRDQPITPALLLVAADLALRLGDESEGLRLAERAYATEPGALTSYALGTLELRRRRYDAAIRLLEQSLAYQPDNPAALFDLSRAYALVHDAPRARAYADRLAALAPSFPGLAEWRAMLAALPGR